MENSTKKPYNRLEKKKKKNLITVYIYTPPKRNPSKYQIPKLLEVYVNIEF